MDLYPLMFDPIYKEKIWGGSKIKELFKRDMVEENIGESFEVSCLDKEVSRINNGYLSGQLLSDLIKEFPLEVLGKNVYDKYGKNFPLLYKFIDAKKDLSIQVHPDEENVKKMSYGNPKTEFWYIIDSNNGKLNVGFKEKIDKDKIKNHIENGSLDKVLEYKNVSNGDAYFIKAGTVHAICANVLLAEIQQASDTTYRLYDYNRKDKNGNLRELHVENALECINFSYTAKESKMIPEVINEDEEYKIFLLNKNEYFTIEKIIVTGMYQTSSMEESFNVIMIVDGHGMLYHRFGEISLFKGDTLFIPSTAGEYTIEGNITLLNSYI